MANVGANLGHNVKGSSLRNVGPNVWRQCMSLAHRDIVF